LASAACSVAAESFCAETASSNSFWLIAHRLARGLLLPGALLR